MIKVDTRRQLPKMSKWKTIPYVIEAEQWITDSIHAMYPTPPAPSHLLRIKRTFPVFGRFVYQLKTFEGWVTLEPSNFIVRFNDDTYGALKADVFLSFFRSAETE